MSTVITPMPGVALVQLGASEFGNVPVPEKAHDSMTSGIVVGMNPSDSNWKDLMGKTIYYRKFKDDARINGKDKLVLIEISDILGSSYDTDSAS